MIRIHQQNNPQNQGGIGTRIADFRYLEDAREWCAWYSEAKLETLILKLAKEPIEHWEFWRGGRGISVTEATKHL